MDKHTAYMLTQVTVNDEKHIAVSNGHYLCTKEEIKKLMDTIQSFYSIENIDDMIIHHNKKQHIYNRLGNYYHNHSIDFLYSDGLYEIPPTTYKYKQFNPKKRHWSCNCGWCGNRVSSKNDDGYFTLNEIIFDIDIERACSEDCAKLIWKEKIKEWIYKNDYQDFFSL